MTILVSGDAGFIGSNLVDKLIEAGHKVIIIDDLSTGNRKFINEKAKYRVKKFIFPSSGGVIYGDGLR